ncbi:MAG: hypothetical protein IKQ96_02550 [Lachnospiraceae bacterium]|nr:hypothetical protein [Lachnospiraceae bacterium]
MVLFFGAFLNGIFGGKNAKARKIIVLASIFLSFLMVVAMIKPVMLEGQIISYWLGNWEPAMGFAFGIGLEVDAVGLFFGLIISTAVLVSGLYSFEYMSHDDALGYYYTLYLMLGGGVLGLVFSGDLFNIFVMVEIMTFSAVALTAFRNEKYGALEAAFKYLVVGSIGSTSVLVGTILLYNQTHTLNLAQIASILPSVSNGVTAVAFGFLFVGFATKAFLFPFQPLAADAHAVAPSSISVLISGVLTKTGVYGIIRLVYVLYQSMNLGPVKTLVVFIGTLSMFICVTMALAQHDFKRLLAFHSISQVGYVITAVGLSTALGVAGGLYHAMNHTLFKSLLFLTAGAVLHQTDTTNLDELGGLSKRMPKTTVLFLIGAASISGLPPFNGFASKWMIYQATFEAAAAQNNFGFALVGIIEMLTSVLTLASFIKVTQSVFFGQMPKKWENVKEVGNGMIIPMGILAALCVITGVAPSAVEKYLLAPATSAVYSVGKYMNAMMGEGFAEGVSLSSETVAVDLGRSGYWNPLAWLALLGILLFGAFVAFVLLRKEAKTKESEAAEMFGSVDEKFEPFFSGERAEFSQVGGSDMFWGFKKVMRPYLDFMHDAHSGVVNDYVRWAVECLALVLLYCVLCGL